MSTDAGVVQVSIAEAQAKTAAALRKIGWDDEDAALQAEIMTAAELCGNNQGLVKCGPPSYFRVSQPRLALVSPEPLLLVVCS